MVITCEQCQARFRLADEKLKPEGTKVRCSKCKHVFTVLPPESSPDDAPVAHAELTMEQAGGEDAASAALPAQTPEPATTTEPIPAAEPSTPPPASGEMDLDFSGLEQSMGAGAGELAEEFSFADTSAAADGPPVEEEAAQASGYSFAEGLAAGGGQGPGELDFDATFAESEEPPAVIAPAAGPAEFAFDQELAQDGTLDASADESAFDFTAEPDTTTPGEFGSAAESEVAAPGEFDFAAQSDSSALGEISFTTEPEASPPAQVDLADGSSATASGGFEFAEDSASELSEFGFETEAGAPPPAPVEVSAPAEETVGFEFGSGDSFESSALSAEPAFGEAEPSWDQPAEQSDLSFNFDEPNFEGKEQERVAKGRDEGGLSFGEIDFSDDDDDKTPSFGSEPDFSQAAMAPPPVPEPLSVSPPPPPPRTEARRPYSGETSPAPLRPRKSSSAKTFGLLALVLIILCGAGGYFYFMGTGRQIIDRLLLKVKGEAPPAPVEQLITLEIAGSSYVKNREAGQLLVVQGTATNNFPTTRSAISIKGVLLDAAGKPLQQQTVFCGNYLDEEKLRTMKYVQIEEAMNNQFGDSLSNMNISPGKVLRFTIVFRNIPREMANINVEVVDSKPGGS
jgi:predicted Zn finger-like uncharacterized protein